MSETIRISVQDEGLDAAIERTEHLIQRNRALETVGLRLIGMIPQLELVERLLLSLHHLSWQTPTMWAIMTGFGLLSGIAGSYQRMSIETEEQMRLNRRALDEQYRRGVPP